MTGRQNYKYSLVPYSLGPRTARQEICTEIENVKSQKAFTTVLYSTVLYFPKFLKSEWNACHMFSLLWKNKFAENCYGQLNFFYKTSKLNFFLFLIEIFIKLYISGWIRILGMCIFVRFFSTQIYFYPLILELLLINYNK